MYLQTPKRPILPPTPSTYGSRTSLPPLSAILSIPKDNYMSNKLPVLETFHVTPNSGKVCDNQQFIHKSDVHSSVNLLTPIKTVIGKEEIKRESYVAEIKIPTPKRPRQGSGNQETKDYAFISHSPATFPSQEPSIDNAPLARRKRRRTSPNELSILNQEFELGSTPNKLKRIEIADKVNMTEKAVQIWFQNKRQSLRKQSTHEKEVTELPPTPPVSAKQLLSSSPSKPDLNSSHSFRMASVTQSSPIKQRSSSIPNLAKFQHPMLTPMVNKTIAKHALTPNSSFTQDDFNTSFDAANSSTLVLNETKKKQPGFLNSDISSTMTFKLTPTSTTSKVNQKLKNIEKESPNSKSKFPDMLNNSTPTKKRKILGEIDINNGNGKIVASKKENESCIENLLSLKAGNWN